MMENYINKLNELNKQIESAEENRAPGIEAKIIYSRLLRDIKQTNKEILSLLRELEELF